MQKIEYVAVGNIHRKRLRELCSKHSIEHKVLTSESRRRLHIEMRKKIVRKLHEEFPRLSSVSLGQLINRHHSVVLIYLKD